MPEPLDLPPREGDRIAKLLARAGIASRREIERMIAEGRVALDGVVLDTPATVLRNLKGVTVDGEPVAPPEAARLFLYHKPTGLLVTEHDPAGRPVIYDRLPRDLPRTMPVGRLDLATEGLLLLTTDGGLKRQLELPATGVERTYRARAYGDVTQAMLEELIEGVEIDGIRYGPIDANLERRTGANTWIELTLTEGKNREVRRVLEHLGLQVGRLIRTRYGPFVLGDLPPGEVGEVKQHDLVAFAKTLAGPRRGKGADLANIIEVEARPKVARPAPAPAPAPRAVRAPAATAPRSKPATGWGVRTRPSRPAAAEDASPRGRFRAVDSDSRPPRADQPRAPRSPRAEPAERSDQGRARPPRATAPRDDRTRPPARDDRARPPARDDRSRSPSRDDRARPPARDARPSPGRPSRTASDPRRERAAREDRAPDQRPPRTAHDTRARPNPSATPPRGGKGPSGGRGHPPRGKPPAGPKGTTRGKR
jgi:23S rRNA pseudouridine2605 synthase